MPPTTSTAVIDLRDGAPGAAALRVHHTWRRIGVVLLAVLNVLDLVTTYAFLDKGVPEGNPVAKHLIESGAAGPLKFALLAALGWLVWTRPPKIGTTCLIWMVNGVYACVVAVNTWVLLSV